MIGTFTFLELICKSCLYIFEINPLLDTNESVSEMNKMILQKTTWRSVRVKSLGCVKGIQFLYTYDDKDFCRKKEIKKLVWRYIVEGEQCVGSDAS